ncbi:hypothetical protein [Gordonia sp. NB41Y]|uniref:hypothetical protein n=1 Tax=Gordonia sp. NB41Y TaxID=875808 RepID=UPI0002BFDA1C|nr:hypothetical protein [Gordonia sp. NB41Y]EMP15264.1 hypothetical protein ISGA_145 [Gordonia sp. NB41Y]WLP90606.1 hypothetical protein Q9K23_24475 [Gordonia sp. NB41Y]
MSDTLSYADFGRRFFEIAVTEDRVRSAFSSVVGDSFEVGPIASGPANIAKVTARVEIREPRVSRRVGEPITFGVQLPLRIGLLVDLRVDRVRYRVDGVVDLRMAARAREPLELHIEVTPPQVSDVRIGVSTTTIRGEIIRVVGRVDDEIKRFIAAYVTEEIDRPEIRHARIIDVATELGRAFESMSETAGAGA